MNQFITTTRELAEYAGRTCTHSGAIHLAIIKQEDPFFNLPMLDSSLSGIERRAIAEIILAKEYNLFVKHKATYLDNKTKMYAIAYGQYSEAMRAKLEGEEGYKEAAMESDVIKLLKIIKRISYQYQSQRYPHRAVHAAMRALYFTSQKSRITLKQYLDKLLNRQDVLE
eukprot:303669-Ditylum_brightwellii.AAC.1